MKKRFNMSAVMTLYTGICMCNFSEAQELMEWIMGHPVWTHEMPMHFDYAKNTIASLFKGLPGNANSNNWQEVLAEAVELHGEKVEIPKGVSKRDQSPIETALQAFTPKKEG
ncbi:MAG TPA: hypothetical protein PLN21_09375 [Gemmatales bacterium]|nr:hypothetical protein [Gemmatales bacterium]